MATSFLQVKNRATTTLASSMTIGDLSMSLTDGSKFPQPGNSFHVTIDNEIIKVTGRSTNTCTVVRGQEGTVAALHNTNAEVRLNITAQLLSDLDTAVNNIEPIVALVPPASGNDGQLLIISSIPAAYVWIT